MVFFGSPPPFCLSRIAFRLYVMEVQWGNFPVIFYFQELSPFDIRATVLLPKPFFSKLSMCPFPYSSLISPPTFTLSLLFLWFSPENSFVPPPGSSMCFLLCYGFSFPSESPPCKRYRPPKLWSYILPSLSKCMSWMPCVPFSSIPIFVLLRYTISHFFLFPPLVGCMSCFCNREMVDDPPFPLLTHCGPFASVWVPRWHFWDCLFVLTNNPSGLPSPSCHLVSRFKLSFFFLISVFPQHHLHAWFPLLP